MLRLQGNAIADVLFGKVNPSGKLPLTFPAREEDIPAYGSFGSENNNVRYSEGLFVGYRWYDKRNVKPLFPFGYVSLAIHGAEEQLTDNHPLDLNRHGLSYTTFAYSDLQISPAPNLLSSDDKMEISFKVTNTGAVAGMESSQVYLTDVVSTLTRPKKELKGFSKVSLEAGQSQTVTVSLGRDAVSFWDDDVDAWRIEAGVFKVRVGKSSVAMELEGEFEIKKGGTWKGL
jgi:beta-glucosidase